MPAAEMGDWTLDYPVSGPPLTLSVYVNSKNFADAGVVTIGKAPQFIQCQAPLLEFNSEEKLL